MEYKTDETIRFDIIDGEMITMENQKLEYSGMVVNGEIYLWTDSSSYIVKNNHVAITNRGTNNIIEN